MWREKSNSKIPITVLERLWFERKQDVSCVIAIMQWYNHANHQPQMFNKTRNFLNFESCENVASGQFYLFIWVHQRTICVEKLPRQVRPNGHYIVGGACWWLASHMVLRRLATWDLHLHLFSACATQYCGVLSTAPRRSDKLWHLLRFCESLTLWPRHGGQWQPAGDVV